MFPKGGWDGGCKSNPSPRKRQSSQPTLVSSSQWVFFLADEQQKPLGVDSGMNGSNSELYLPWESAPRLGVGGVFPSRIREDIVDKGVTKFCAEPMVIIGANKIREIC